MAPLITLTTDFGEESPYVAAMKGVILSINPEARLLDLGHSLLPQDLRHAAFFLAAAIPYFPADAIHVVVVDPGVGSERALLYVEVQGHRLLVPDNGCWTSLIPPEGSALTVVRLTESRYWRQPVSATFHGRDILAPAAAHLSLGVDPQNLGTPWATWVRLEIPKPQSGVNSLRGEVIFIDHFGNLITNLSDCPRPDILCVGKQTFRRRFRWVRNYSEADSGALVALISSTGNLEVAVVKGNAARRLRASIGTPVEVGWVR
jgi:S-adenosylmethionine hydrolase